MSNSRQVASSEPVANADPFGKYYGKKKKDTMSNRHAHEPGKGGRGGVTVFPCSEQNIPHVPLILKQAKSQGFLVQTIQKLNEKMLTAGIQMK